MLCLTVYEWRCIYPGKQMILAPILEKSRLDRAPGQFKDYLLVPTQRKADVLLTTVLSPLRGGPVSVVGRSGHRSTVVGQDSLVSSCYTSDAKMDHSLWNDYIGFLTIDGHHDSEQADQVLFMDCRPRGRRASLTALLPLTPRTIARLRPPLPSVPSSRWAYPLPSPPSPPPGRYWKLGSGRLWADDAGSLSAICYTVAVSDGFWGSHPVLAWGKAGLPVEHCPFFSKHKYATGTKRCALLWSFRKVYVLPARQKIEARASVGRQNN